MKRYTLSFLLFFIAAGTFAQAIKVTNLKCDNSVDPVGMINTEPHFSWEIVSATKNTLQQTYHVLVADDPTLLQKGIGNIWDSQRVNSNASIQVAYAGAPLVSTKKYYWRVMVVDNKARASAWSPIASFQMGLLSKTDWKGANWIGYQEMADAMRILPELPVKGSKGRSPGSDILPIMRKSFKVKKPVRSATMFISGLGHFEMSLNGKKVGDHFLDGGWVNYLKEAQYVTFDLTGMLKGGENAIGVMLGNGFYFTPSGRYRKLTLAYGYPKMICRLLINYADGSTDNVISDPTWKTAESPITFSAIYGGEDYDANKEQAGWDMPGFDDKNWKNALVVDGPALLNPQMARPLKVMETLAPKKITQPKPGVWVYDLGQNASGIPQITVRGKKGDTVKMIPSELLDKNGVPTQNNTGKGYILTYVLKGDGAETWQPRFTYYGFRYLQVEGANPQTEANPKNLPQILDIKGLHTRNSAERVGEFSSSSDLFNKTNTLIDWSIKSNMASVLTDCPHREKLGWLEEDHLMGNSLQYNYDLATLFKKIVNDMRESQTESGLVPEISPEYAVFGDGFRDSPEWGSNCILLPWYIYQWYGDKQVLADSYDMMKRYVAYLDKLADNHILTQGLGDWYDIGPAHPGVSQLTPKGVTATAFYYYDLTLLSRIAVMLNKTQEGNRFARQAADIKTAFNNKFFNKETKQYATNSQTANAIAVYMKLVEPEDKAAVVDNIVKELRGRNNTLTAGDIGYRYLLKVLDDEGRSDVIFDMNNRSDVPGYGFQLAKGATALTESWQALAGVSNNHFMLGHLMEWFYEGLAGIRPAPDAVAYNKIVIRPEVVGDITSAKGSYHSVYGMIKTDWKLDGKTFMITVEIPANTTATVYLPAKLTSKIMQDDKLLSGLKNENGKELVNIGSGVYHFKVTE